MLPAKRWRASAERTVCQRQMWPWMLTKRARNMCGQSCGRRGGPLRRCDQGRKLGLMNSKPCAATCTLYSFVMSLLLLHHPLHTVERHILSFVLSHIFSALSGANRGAAGGAGCHPLQGEHAVAWRHGVLAAAALAASAAWRRRAALRVCWPARGPRHAWAAL